jgi:hypothetical protein
MTPDWAVKPTTVPYAKFGDPQTLNLYSYVENAPVNRADADGHCLEDFCVLEIGALVAFAETPAGQRVINNGIGIAAGVGVAAIAYSSGAIDKLGQIGKNFLSKNAPAPKSNPAPGTQAGNPHAPGDVPNGQTVVRGGQGAIPSSGTYSGAQGASVAEAGKGVPHGTVSTTTAGEIRSAGGEVRPAPEPAEREPSCRLTVVLSGGRRIEVQRDFDTHTFERLVSVLERV